MFGEATHRVWCSEILSMRLEFASGRRQQLNVNLEELWPAGALFQTEARIPLRTRLKFARGGRTFRGKVTAQTFSRGLGYFVEIRFDRNCQWSTRQYRPKHLLNPLVLLASRFFEATLRRPSGVPGNFPLASPFAANASSAVASAASSQGTVPEAGGVRRVA